MIKRVFTIFILTFLLLFSKMFAVRRGTTIGRGLAHCCGNNSSFSSPLVSTYSMNLINSRSLVNTAPIEEFEPVIS